MSQTIELYHKKTRNGEYSEHLTFDNGNLYKENYRYYVSRKPEETVWGLCRNSNFVLDRVKGNLVKLSKPSSNETVDIWTTTNEVEIYSKDKVYLTK